MHTHKLFIYSFFGSYIYIYSYFGIVWYFMYLLGPLEILYQAKIGIHWVWYSLFVNLNMHITLVCVCLDLFWLITGEIRCLYRCWWIWICDKIANCTTRSVTFGWVYLFNYNPIYLVYEKVCLLYFLEIIIKCMSNL